MIFLYLLLGKGRAAGPELSDKELQKKVIFFKHKSKLMGDTHKFITDDWKWGTHINLHNTNL